MQKRTFFNSIFITFLGFIFFVVGVYVGQLSLLNVNNSILKKVVSVTAQDKQNSVSRDLTENIPDFVQEDEVDFDLFWDVWETMDEKYYEQPVSDKTLFYGAIKGMVESVDDPYTVFFEPKEAEEFSKELEGVFEGIGAELGIKQELLTVIAPLPNSPAERAGLLPGDKIIAVDGKESFYMSIEEAVSIIRGPKGTPVLLTVIHKDENEPVEIEIIRDKIVINTVTVKEYGNKGDIMYIRIFSFNEDTARDFREIVNNVKEKNPRGIILDLRSNPGGYLQDAVEIASMWIDNGVIVMERFSDNSTRPYNAQGEDYFKDYKTIVLVNEGSASASEIVAGALRDYGRATVVGEQTFGKGSIQEYSTYRGGAALKVTVAEWLTPNGTSINKEGIVPDIEVELTREDYNADKDPQLDKAIELLQ